MLCAILFSANTYQSPCVSPVFLSCRLTKINLLPPLLRPAIPWTAANNEMWWDSLQQVSEDVRGQGCQSPGSGPWLQQTSHRDVHPEHNPVFDWLELRLLSSPCQQEDNSPCSKYKDHWRGEVQGGVEEVTTRSLRGRDKTNAQRNLLKKKKEDITAVKTSYNGELLRITGCRWLRFDPFCPCLSVDGGSGARFVWALVWVQ